MTVALEIRRPWRQRPSRGWPKGYRPSWVTIWHCDPEIRGDDDSCDWSGFRHLTDTTIATAAEDLIKDEELIRRLSALIQTRVMFDARYPSLKEMRPADGYAAALMVLSALRWRAHRKHPNIDLFELATQLALNPFDNVNGFETPESYIKCLARHYQRSQRPWWRHPRWHLWHWRIQVHPWQQFRRWLLTRCTRCGKRFRYGESPVSHSWDSPRPRWFRGEVGLYHSDCSGHSMVQTANGPFRSET